MVRNHAYVMMKLREEQRKCLSLFRRNLRAQDKEKLISLVPDLYRAVQMEQNKSPQEFISVRYLQDKLNHAVDLNNLPKLGKKDIEKSYSRIEKNLSKLSTFPVQQN